MTNEEYNDLFHRAELNLVAFKMVNHCDDEIKRMVEMAVAAEREACIKVCEQLEQEWEDAELWSSFKAVGFVIDAIRSRK